MIIAWLKLRKRNLGPILDANGWAVNARARLNVPFGASLTGVPELPPNAKIGSDDRFSERPSAWPKIALFVVIVCFLFSLLNHFYVLDMIAYKLTDKHYPAFFRQAPPPSETKKDQTPTGDDVTAVTNAPTADATPAP